MSRRIIVVINEESGSPEDDHPTVIAQALDETEAAAEIRTCAPEDLDEEMQAAIGEKPDVLGIYGGDGTLNGAANLLVGSEIALGVLPGGTFNNFATDLGIPDDMADAARLLAEGEIAAIDVGEVNGLCFLNNSSIGAYPEAVRRRGQLQEKWRLPKILAMFAAAAGILWRFRLLNVTLKAKNGVRVVRAPFVFIGNNRYHLEPLAEGHRETLDQGLLSLIFSEKVGRLEMLRIMLSVLFGKGSRTPKLNTHTVGEVEIISRKKRLRVSLDGEITILQPPLQYKSHPQALRIVKPKEEE